MKRTKLMAYALLMMICIAVNAAYSLAHVQTAETALCAAPAMPAETSEHVNTDVNTAALPTVPAENNENTASAPTLEDTIRVQTANLLWDSAAPESIQSLGELLTDKKDTAALLAAAAAYNREKAEKKEAEDAVAPAGPTLVSLGAFKMTAYCPCPKCCGRWSRTTSSGRTAVSSHTVAVDPRVIPMGSRIMINGKEYVAEDTGGSIKGNRIDIFFDTHSEAKQYGVQRAEVFLIQQ
ncbi:MAG: hypothetical protein HFE84_11645 [Lachnospiraceae bacterium]|nr:hypothetical protein [Lachnospiraceae bacterium]